MECNVHNVEMLPPFSGKKHNNLPICLSSIPNSGIKHYFYGPRQQNISQVATINADAGYVTNLELA